MKSIIRFAACCAAFVLAGACFAQAPGAAPAWPSKPMRIIVPFAPGGPADIIARLVGQKLTEILGQPMIIDNRAGAGGNIGTAAVAKSAADGYTMLITSSAFVVNVSLFPNAGYDAERDFIPTAVVATQPNLIVVNPSVQARTLAELLAFAKTTKLAYASPGSGTTPHLTGENLFNVIARLDMTPIHFRGAGPAVAAVVAGEPLVGSMAICRAAAPDQGRPAARARRVERRARGLAAGCPDARRWSGSSAQNNTTTKGGFICPRKPPRRSQQKTERNKPPPPQAPTSPTGWFQTV